MSPYPTSYHMAINHLVRHGCWHAKRTGRTLCALALRDLRRLLGHTAARHERQHMRQICGMFPQVPSNRVPA